MERKVSLSYNLTKEEHENFVQAIDFLKRKGFPVDFKSIMLAGLNQALNNYFKEEWRKEQADGKN